MLRVLLAAVALVTGLVVPALAQQCGVPQNSANSQQSLLNLQNQVLAAQLAQQLPPAPAGAIAQAPRASTSAAASASASADAVPPAPGQLAVQSFAPVMTSAVMTYQAPMVTTLTVPVAPVAYVPALACNTCNSGRSGILSRLRPGGGGRSRSVSRSTATTIVRN